MNVASGMSVSMSRDITQNSSPVAITSAARKPARGFHTREPNHQTRSISAVAKTAVGIRPANSVSPNALNDPATSQ